jgi:alkylation response protein AidB-like acyl-CoA dehydrogenase
MSLELTARTEAGARLVALAETLAAEIGPRAAEHDRDGSFPFESFAAVKRSGYFAAPVPEQLDLTRPTTTARCTETGWIMSALRGGFPIGDAIEYMERNLAAGLFHAAAALGIAESACLHAAAGLARREQTDPHVQMLAAENVPFMHPRGSNRAYALLGQLAAGREPTLH